MTVNLKTGQGSGGHAAGDTLTGIENIRGAAHDDTLTGNDGDNHLYGGGGNDMLRGGIGDDTLEGGDGMDVFNGGYLGNDTLTGGADADTFRFIRETGQDRITDFESGTDKIGLSRHIEPRDGISLIENDNGDAVIQWIQNQVTIEGVAKSVLKPDDFLFNGQPLSDEWVDMLFG